MSGGLTVDGKAVPNNIVLENAGAGNVSFNGNQWSFSGNSNTFQLRITRRNDVLDKQIQEIKFNVNSQSNNIVTTNNHSGTGYLLEGESEISLGNGLIQKFIFPILVIMEVIELS